MSYLGSWKIDDALTFPAITHRFDTGALTDADAVPAYRVYEDETGTAILTGNMAKLDDANTTGFYSEQITLSAANGFEKGKCYTIYITAAVNSVTGGQHHTFQVEAEVDANRLNWANVDNPTTAVGLSGTTVKTATDVETDTQDIQARLPAALVSGKIDASVGAIVAAALAQFFTVNSGSTYAAAVAGSVVKETADNAGGSSLTEGGIADAVWDELLAGHAGVGSAGEALAAAGSGADAGAIADAVWDEARAGHVAGGSFGEGVASVQGNVTGSVASVTAKVTPIDVDGITHASAMEALLAVLKGVTTVNGNVVTFFLADGTTAKVRITMGTARGERSNSEIDPA